MIMLSFVDFFMPAWLSHKGHNFFLYTVNEATYYQL